MVGSTAYFQASDPVERDRLWQSDGTTGGTTLLADIYPGSRESVPRELINVGGTVFFTADDGTHGRGALVLHP